MSRPSRVACSYAIGVKHEVVNTGSAAVTPQLYLQLMRDGTHEGADSAFYSTYTGPAFYSEEQKFQKVSFEDITKGKASFQETANSGYVAMVQHYFASAWLLGEASTATTLPARWATTCLLPA